MTGSALAELPRLGLGLGLRSAHFRHLMATDPADWQVDWFEAISENVLDDHGYAREVVRHVAAHRPLVLHGVSLSIGSSDPLDLDYVRRLAALADALGVAWVSDHLCWTGINGLNSHDLLPLPLNEETLAHVGERVAAVQDILGRPLILENPSTYLRLRASTMPEWEFLGRLSEASGCGLLLDVNNVYVSTRNLGGDPFEYIRNIPAERVVQLHVAGHTDCGTHVIDTHDHPVPAAVWRLYRLAHERSGGASTLLEWDASIPPYEELVAELAKARGVLEGELPTVALTAANQAPSGRPISTPIDHLLQVEP